MVPIWSSITGMNKQRVGRHETSIFQPDCCYFPYREKGYLEEAAEAVGGDGFDVIIENASDINLGSDLTVIGPGGRVVVSKPRQTNRDRFPFISYVTSKQIVGNRGNVEISPRYLMTEEGSIVGCALFRSTPVSERNSFMKSQVTS